VYIVARYRLMLISWAYIARIGASEQPDDIADEALARAWTALSPSRFSAFPNLAAILAYLRTSVIATAIDCARTQAKCERLVQQLRIGVIVTPEEIILKHLERTELWLLVNSQIGSEHERVILVESIVYSLPPRMILTRHRDLLLTLQLSTPLSETCSIGFAATGLFSNCVISSLQLSTTE
jgi:DNA-directed RNA polymerase specialized sigma24 family protein